MKITSVKIHSAAVERQYATVIAKAGGAAKDAVAKSHFYFLEVTTDKEHAGWGEVSDVPHDELLADPDEYAEMLAAFLSGRSPFDVQRMHGEFREHFGAGDGEDKLPRYVECALDMAFYDLAGKATGRSVSELLGGAMRRDVAISWVAFIRDDLDSLRDEIREKTAAGFTAFKLKVGVDIDLDEQRLAIAREVAGPEASIKIDANEGWSVATAPKNIRRLNKYGLAGVETPVPRENPQDIAAVRKQVDVPILEHVSDLSYGLELIKAGAVDVFNISTPGAGGIWPARQIAMLAEAAGIGVLVGSTVELGPGTLAQLHFAGATPNLVLPNDLVGPGLYKRDVLKETLRYRQGKLGVPTGPGLGLVIDRDKLRRASS